MKKSLLTWIMLTDVFHAQLRKILLSKIKFLFQKLSTEC